MKLKNAILFAASIITAPFTQSADFSVVRSYVYPIIVANNATTMINRSGSGIVIKEGYILSVAHVMPDTGYTAYISYMGRMLPARVMKVDKVNDLALLEADVFCPCAPISASPRVEIDATAYAVGFPLFLDYKLQILTIGNIQGISSNELMTTSVTAPGGSGGGVFVKEKKDYKLIGIVKSIAVYDIGPKMMKVEQMQNWFVSSVRSTTIRDFLKGTKGEVK